MLFSVDKNEKFSRRVVRHRMAAPITYPFNLLNVANNQTSFPPQIFSVAIALTSFCPLSCAHCYNFSSPGGKKKLAVEKIIDAIKALRCEGNPVQYVGLSGG